VGGKVEDGRVWTRMGGEDEDQRKTKPRVTLSAYHMTGRTIGGPWQMLLHVLVCESVFFFFNFH
jgi:hypothetical protein